MGHDSLGLVGDWAFFLAGVALTLMALVLISNRSTNTKEGDGIKLDVCVAEDPEGERAVHIEASSDKEVPNHEVPNPSASLTLSTLVMPTVH